MPCAIWLLPDDIDRVLVWTFAFVPARYDSSALTDGLLPGGWGAEIWTFFTYALLHADLDASRLQCGLAARLRKPGGAPVRDAAFSAVLRGDGGRRGRWPICLRMPASLRR